MQAMYEKFNAWREKFRDNLADLGGRLGAGKVAGQPASDGPFVEVKELVGGYMIVIGGAATPTSRKSTARPRSHRRPAPPSGARSSAGCARGVNW
jgi:hypothetical protein